MFPKMTEFNKRIPKTKFYEKLELNKSVKRSFLQDIDTIVWSNKLAPSTINITAGKKVEEIEVFTITLKSGTFDKNILKVIDEQIPYHILFLLVCGERRSLWIGYKVKSRGKAFRVISYYSSGKLSESIPDLQIEGADLDNVYAGFIKQLSTIDTEYIWDDNESLDDNINAIEKHRKLLAEIQKLELRMKKESQPKKKLELHNKINELKRRI